MTRTPEPIGVVGLGRVGSHAARQLRTGTAPLRVYDIDRARRTAVLAALRPGDGVAEPNGGPGTTVVVATPAGNHAEFAAPLIRSGVSVISTSDDPADVQDLLTLDELAKSNEVTVVVGAGLSPGFSCLLAAHAARRFLEVQELSVWTTGTAGPACARRHHRSLQQPGLARIDNRWVEKRGGSGRDLAWFPGALGARDCYRGALAEPVLLHRQFPKAERISARTSANRRDRITSRLPMLRAPHDDGGPGGFRLEVRGITSNGYHTEVVGIMAFPSVASGTVAAVAANWVHHSDSPAGVVGVAELGAPAQFLTELHHRGLTAARFLGIS
ncbi:MAG: hypothetical protein HKN03_08645 [Acidimicrobiales bacterium]|nr:hypothetical protein [Acidimicrobiales bacterium]